MPFGEELGAGVGNRTELQKYSTLGADNIRKRFTGYEKDTETDLDFAEARMYQNKHGRFTAVDPLLASASTGNPQTFNRYIYVGNNPVNSTDPSGLCEVNGKEDGKPCSNFSGQVYKHPKGGLADHNCTGCTAYNGPRVTISAYGATYRITGGANGGWVQIGRADVIIGDDSVPIESSGGVISDSISLPGGSPGTTNDPLMVGNGSGVSNGIDFLPEVPSPDPDDNPGRDAIILLSLLPGPPGMVFDVVNAGMNASEGNYRDALIDISGLFSAGDLLKIGKISKIVNKLGNSDAARVAPCLLCFVAGTQVQTIDGLKLIEEIEIGDQVLSYNEQTKQNEYQVVYYTFRRFADDIYSIKIENEEKPLEVTSEHPFYIKIHQARDNLATDDDEGEWEEVRDLEIGDEIRLVSGGWAKILDIKFKGKGEVFNFSVAKNNNYYVGNSRLLTHNANCYGKNPIINFCTGQNAINLVCSAS